MSATETTGASELTRTGLGADALRRAVLENLACLRARYPEIASPHDWYMALAYSVRDRLLARWVNTTRRYFARMSILNTARSGKFSSDRAIREYCREIWNVRAVRIADG